MDKTRFRKWARRLLGSLAGLIVFLVLVAGAALVLLDSDDIKRFLVWEADRYLDASLQINGEFSIALGRETTLIADQVTLRAHDGSYTVSAGRIHLKQRLGSYLMTGTLWINSLELSDIQWSMQQGAGPEFDLAGMTLPPVVIEQAKIHNLHASYRSADGENQEIALLDLVIDDVNNAGPLGVTGEGMIDGQSLEVEGSLGSLATLVNGQPYPVSLAVTSGSLAAQLAGSIDDPVDGKGVDLSLSLADPTLSQTLGIFDKSLPETGALTARAKLRGDYDAPRLDDIDIHLQHDPDLDIRVSGEVADLTTGAGLSLAVRGRCSDRGLMSWLAAAVGEHLESVTASGTVREENGRFLISDVLAEGRTDSGVSVGLSGTTRIPTEDYPRPAKSPALLLSVSAPSLKALDIKTLADAPELGRVSASARYRPYRDGSGLSDITLEAGDARRLKAVVKGDIDFIPYTGLQGMTGIKLRADLSAATTPEFGRLIDHELPELGAVKLDMQVTGGSENLAIDKISLTAGPPAQPVINVSGTARTQQVHHNSSALRLGFDADVTQLVAALRKTNTDDLGHLQGTLSASNAAGGTWRVDSFNIVSTQTNLYSARFSGSVNDIVRRNKAEINLVIDIPDPAALGSAAGFSIGKLAAYHGEGRLSFNNKQVDYHGNGMLGKTRSSTQLTGSLAGDKPVLKGSFDIPVLYLTDFALEPELPPELVRPDVDQHKSTAQGAPLFSREALDFSWLDRLNLDLAIAIDQIESREITAEKLQGRIVLQDGLLHISPMRLVAEGGPADLDLEIDARSTPVITLRLSANDQKLGRWIAQIQNDIPVDGFASYDIDLVGSGHSPHDIVSGLNGTIGLAFENARIPSEYVEYLSVDVFGWVLSKTRKKERYADIDCVLAEFDVNQGVMTSTLLASDGPRISIEGKMTLDLGKETIDAVFLPKQKKTLFSDIAPVKITGSMQDPDVHAIPAREAVTRIGSLILIPYVAIPVTLLGKLWDSLDDHDQYGGGCASLKAEKDSEIKKTSR